MGSKENFVFGEKNLLNTIRVTFPHFPSFRYTHCYTSKSQTTIGFGQWVSGCSMKLKITIHMFSELAKSTCLKKVLKVMLLRLLFLLTTLHLFILSPLAEMFYLLILFLKKVFLHGSISIICLITGGFLFPHLVILVQYCF